MESRRRYRATPAPKRSRAGLIIIVLIAVAVVTTQVSRVIHFVDTLAKPSSQINSKAQAALVKQVNGLINNYKNTTVSVSLIDLDSNQQINFGSRDPLGAASITKLATAADYLHQVERGNASLNQQIGDAPASWQLQEMVQDSDNDSWDLLDNWVGYDQLADYAHSQGLTSFDLANNQVKAPDEARFLANLQNGTLLNPSHTKLLLSYMVHTNEESYIPAAVPSGLTVHHKYGLLGGSLNDAAIVTGGPKPFVLVIFTQGADLSDQTVRIDLLHQITRAVVGYES